MRARETSACVPATLPQGGRAPWRSQVGERREERLGDNLLDEMRRVQRKAWELLDKTESEGDHRGSIVALREVRACAQREPTQQY